MTDSLLVRASRAVRAADWWAFKIPPLLAIAYAGFARFTLPDGAWIRVAGALGAILFVAVYGYVLNDICDIEADRRSRRRNRMASVGTAGRIALLTFPIAGAVAIVLATGDAFMLAVLGLNLLLPTLYSVPPVRLKERGPWGAIADASGVHALPSALVAYAATSTASEPAWLTGLFVVSVVGWALFAGLRGIIVHQVADRSDDLLADVTTFAGTMGVARSRHLVMRRLLPAELGSLIVFLAVVLPHAPGAALILATFAVLEAIKVRQRWTLPLFEPDRDPPEPYVPVVNNELYEMWMPFAFGLQLAIASRAMWAVLAVQALVFLPMLRVRFGGVLFLLRTLNATPGASPENSDSTVGPGSSASPSWQVVIGATTWTINGVNVFSLNLARGLRDNGVAAHILLTENNTNLVTINERVMPLPGDVSFLPLPVIPADGWGKHWGATVRHLEEAAPCVYIPNYDWRHSCVCPQLSDDVVVVGVVHSDDPLHYDHVRRLGRYWNAIVAVSRAIAERTAQECPDLADRIITIPNGVRMPRSHARRPGTHKRLRVIYHGILKQHQKRVLDLPGIVQAAADLGVAVELTIVGAGPDEAALRAAAAPLVDRGLVHFQGLVPPDELPALLEAHDVYLLTSEFEGMPNALIEAMGRGCVPVVTRSTSGILEIIRDGRNGFLVPIGDTAAFADRLRVLWKRPGRRSRMAKRAYRSVASGRFHVERMVEAYQLVFERAWRDVRQGTFTRPRGPLAAPAREVAGVSVFPVELPHVEADLGAFPSVDDARDYREEIRAIVSRTGTGPKGDLDPLDTAAARVNLDGVRVFVSVPIWTHSGVNLWSADLVRGLRAAGLDARILLTEEETDLVRVDEPRMARPPDLAFEDLDVDSQDNWGLRWGTLARTLEAAAPCIYFPSYDWRHSAIVPVLSDRVVVIGTMNDSGALYTEHAARLGRHWNAVVATSREIAGHVRRQFPELADRLVTIPGGSTVPADIVQKELGTAAARVLCIEEFENNGERDLPLWTDAIAQASAALSVVVVDPPASTTVTSPHARVVVRPNRRDWLDLCRAGHFVVANRFHGGAEDRLVEAMGHGCIPIWVGATPPDARLVIDGDTGVIVPPGRWDIVLDRMRAITANPEAMQRMARRAHDAARAAVFRNDQMIERYLDLFRHAIADAESGRYQRPRGPVVPPPASVDGISVLPVDLPCHTPLGSFASPGDAADFERQAAAVGILQPGTSESPRALEPVRSLTGVKVFVATPVWTSTGVNLWSEDLVRGLRSRGLDARLLLTEEATHLIRIDEPRLDRPADLPIDELTVDGIDNWGARWGALIRMLEANSPCIYLPSYDWRHSGIAPALSNNVVVVGTLSDAGSLYTEHAARMGDCWNGVVAMSDTIADHVRRQLPHLSGRLSTIPHGLSLPSHPVQKDRRPDEAVTIVIPASDDQGVERCAWIEAVSRSIARAAFHLVVVDPPPSTFGHLEALGVTVVIRPNRLTWLELCRAGHFVIAGDSGYETRRRVIEAMAHGCIPVWDSRAAQDDVLARHREAVVTVMQDDWNAAVSEIGEIVRDPERMRRMADRAFRTARRAAYGVDRMIDSYLELFQRLLDDVSEGRFTRTAGPLRPPPPSLDGCSVLPIEYTCGTSFGMFPTELDAERFAALSGLVPPPSESDPT